MKKEKSFRVFVIYALLLQFGILISQQSLLIESTSTTIPNYNTRDATVQVMVSYTDPLVNQSLESAYTGTGAIIADENGWIYVLTARHVCSPNPFHSIYFGMQENVEIQDIDGNFHDAEITLISQEDDLCIVKYFSDVNSNRSIAKFSNVPPNLDSPVFMYAAPAGFYVPSAITRFSGTFSGDAILWGGEHSAVYTMPAAGGASGAAITNSNGEIIGVLHSTLSDFHHISLSTTYDSTINFIEALEEQENITILD